MLPDKNKVQFQMLHYKIMRIRSYGLQHRVQNYGLQSVKNLCCLVFQICVVKLSFVQGIELIKISTSHKLIMLLPLSDKY
jgi:hypothetical protein